MKRELNLSGVPVTLNVVKRRTYEDNDCTWASFDVTVCVSGIETDGGMTLLWDDDRETWRTSGGSLDSWLDWELIEALDDVPDARSELVSVANTYME